MNGYRLSVVSWVVVVALMGVSSSACAQAPTPAKEQQNQAKEAKNQGKEPQNQGESPRDKIDKLMTEYQLILQKHKTTLAELEVEINKMAAERRLLEAKANRKNTPEQLELAMLSLQSNLRQAKDKASAEYVQAQKQLAALRLKKQLHDALAGDKRIKVEDEIAQLTLEGNLRNAHTTQQQADDKDEIARLALQGKLRIAHTTQKQAHDKDEIARLSLQDSLRNARTKRQNAEVEAQIAALNLEMRLRQVKSDNDLSKMRVEIAKLNLQRQLQETQTKAAQVKHDTEIADMTADVKLREQNQKWKSEVNRKLSYLKEPFHDGVLVISDRRIALNDVIISGTADYVTRRIHYYNNKSTEHPIFIVIDKCYGGSVMEGYRIVEAMQASKAPVYVVVKQYAASMAAIITTLAQKSYAYPNAIILHHEMQAYTWGSLTDQKEQMKILEEWSSRLLVPVAAKMGITQEQFVKQMYAHNTRGNWQEFGDKANEVKWVGQIVHEIQEAGVTKQPTDQAPSPWRFFFMGEGKDKKFEDRYELRDAEGKRYVTLPRLTPYDFYYIYNPDHYYR